MRDEAQAIFYHENHLRICYGNLAPVNVTNIGRRDYIRTISQPRWDAIRAVTLVISSWTEIYRAAIYVQHLPALTDLHIEMDGSNEDATNWEPLLREENRLTKALMASHSLLVFQLRLSARPLRIFLGSRGTMAQLFLQEVEGRMQAHLKRRDETQ